MTFRIVFAQVGAPFLVQFVRPGLKRNLPEACEAEPGIPYSREVDLAFRRARSRPNGSLLRADGLSANIKMDFREQGQCQQQRENRFCSYRRRQPVWKVSFLHFNYCGASGPDV